MINRFSNNSHSVALLVHACDRYEFLFKGFECFFTRYWDFKIPCNYYFATEEKEVSLQHFQNLQSGKGQWTDRLKVLLNKIPEDYILYFQEDMWLNKEVNAAFFPLLFNMAAVNNWKQVKLHSSEVYSTVPTEFFIAGFNIAKVDNQSSGFLMSHQVTLWNKQFLLQQLSHGEHPWRNERRGTKRLKRINPTIYHVDYFAENGNPEINTNEQPVKRSEYRTISVNATLNRNVIPFILVLQQGPEAEKHYAEELLFQYKKGLTHDGKRRPR